MSIDPGRLVRLKSIIGADGLVPMSRSNWYGKVAAGRAPKAVKYGRLSYWRLGDIELFLENPDEFYQGKSGGAE
jgi:predicted DNA-binding transcriptional regulator AlpA